MIWVDQVVKKIKQRNFPLEWVDDMKTPSGRIHVGALRGVVIHDSIYKALKEIGVKAKFTYVINDMDPMDSLPSYLDENKWKKYMGYPLYKIPSPDGKAKNYALYFAQEFIEVFNLLDCSPKIIWSSNLYRSGKMNKIIKLFLNKKDKIRGIYRKVTKADKPEDWFPYQPVCPKCGRIGTTSVYHWDGQYVYFRCQPNKVGWAKGCDHQGQVEPAGENGKLPWKLDWPAHWKAIGVTIESSGKDHMSAGGSYDFASHICREILKIEPPEAFGGYEWFTVGGRKMSSSKGIGSSAKEIAQILPPELLRFLLIRSPISRHIDFNPTGQTIPCLFDEYDRCLMAYFDTIENNIPKGKKGEVKLNLARIIELSKVRPLPKKRLFLPRFRTIVNLIKSKKTKKEMVDFFAAQKGDRLTKKERDLLSERMKYGKIYLDNYYQEEEKVKKNFVLTNNQKRFLKKLLPKLSGLKTEDKKEIQKIIRLTIKESNFSPREVFEGFYFVLTGKPYGPRAVDLILNLGIKKVKERLKKVL